MLAKFLASISPLLALFLRSPYMYTSLYRNQKISAGYPNLPALCDQHQSNAIGTEIGRDKHAKDILRQLLLLLPDHIQPLKVAVVGCGPNPVILKECVAAGLSSSGLEPFEHFVAAARKFLDGCAQVETGKAEVLPFADASQDAVILESVLEHVNSPSITLREAYRVLKPDGVLFISTTNRLRISLIGENGEYTTPFFNWFPRILKETYIFHQLHYDPSLARYTPFPAVHWFCYSQLCQLGREAGFAHFYSQIDVADSSSGVPKERFLSAFKYHPWLKSLLLTQVGGTIFMVKKA